jgi:cell division septal protein FtsQ
MGRGVKLNKKRPRRKTFQNSYSIASPKSIKRINIDARLAKRLAVALVLPALIIGLIYWVVFSPAFKVHSTATITGVKRLESAEVYAASGIDGKSIFSISPKKVENRLKSELPYIKSVKVKVALPNKVMIRVEEREPLIEWDNPVKPMWISEDGTVLRIIGDAFDIMHLYDQEGKAVGKDGKMPVDYVKGMELLHDQLQISDFTMGKKGLEIRDPAGWEVYFGAPHKLCSRIDRYLKLRKEWLNEVHPKYVDARYDRFYVGH